MAFATGDAAAGRRSARLHRLSAAGDATATSIGSGFPTILVAAQAGGEWALAALYTSLDPQLRRYLRAQVGQDVDDVSSDSWLAIARNLHTFEGGEDAFRAWAFTIANRRVVDHLRRRGRRPEDSASDTFGLGATESARSAEESAWAGDLGDQAAARIVAALPAEQARIVLLRVVAGLSVEEVAAIVGRKPGHVRVLQHRALRRLAKNFPSEV